MHTMAQNLVTDRISQATGGNGKSHPPETQLQRRVCDDLVGTLGPMSRRGKLWVGLLVTVVAAGLYAYVLELVFGLKVTAMREHVSWGLYMTNFVFFIGVSHAGTLISAILRVTNAEWRRPITRMAEAITVFALLVGAPMVIIDMGRPDRLHHVLLYGRFNSPILWDVCSIATYISGSLLYLYVAMIPDLALLAARAETRCFAPGEPGCIASSRSVSAIRPSSAGSSTAPWPPWPSSSSRWRSRYTRLSRGFSG